MSTFTTNTTKSLAILGLLFFSMRIQSGVEAGSPFITPEFAIPEVPDDEEIFFDYNDSPLVKTRRPFFRQRINMGINNIINKPDPTPPPPTTPPSPVPGTDPLVVEEETDNTSNILLHESLERNVPRVNESDDISINESMQSDASSSSSSEKLKTERYFSFPRSGGRLGFEIQSSTVNGSKKKRSTTTTSSSTTATAFSPSTSRQTLWRRLDTTTKTTVADTDAIELSLDASSVWNLAKLIADGTATTGFAVLGTLRLLAPMLLARRVLLYFLNVASDWYTGR